MRLRNRVLLLLAGTAMVAAGCSPAATTMGERPEAIPVSYEEAGQMDDGAFNAAVEKGHAVSARFRSLELEKFRAGDAVHRQVGPLEMTAVFDPLTQTGHFSFVHDPAGVEGEITTFTLIVGVDKNGVIVRDEHGRLLQVIKTDIGRTPDVARLIISKIGDIFTGALNGIAGAGLNAAFGGCKKDCGTNLTALAGATSLAQNDNELGVNISSGKKGWVGH